MLGRKKILAYSDSASVFTGFGVVSKYILTALYNTGKYDISQYAVNYPVNFNTLSNVPWTQIPAKLYDSNDVYGKKGFLRVLAEGDFDFVWIVNDLHIASSIAPFLKKTLEAMEANGKKVPKIIYYYPVDCHVRKDSVAMLELADTPVAYTKYGMSETLKRLPHFRSKLKQIYHGVNTDVYKPFKEDEKQRLKKKYLGDDSDKFVFLSVNRNIDRKQISRTILAFKKFLDRVPDSVLLLHTMPIDKNLDRVVDLTVCLEDLGLTMNKDVFFPNGYNLSNGWPEKMLNEIYNISDCFITTHLGEGFGLTIAEAMAAGIPVIVPDNTNMSELVGEDQKRGYMYDCEDYIYIDNAGYRPFGSLGNIPAREWAEENSWNTICRQWIDLFEELSGEKEAIAVPDEGIKGLVI